MSATRRINRERARQTLTFWLRPEFVLRVLNRFQKVAGFDRAVALASGALTAMIPLLIVTGSLSSQLGGKDTAQRIIDRYDLTGGGAQAVKDVFAQPSGTSSSLGVAGFLFLILAVLSFTRAVQRLFEQTWELEPLSVRNTSNGLLWVAGLTLYLILIGTLHALLGDGGLELGAALISAPVSAVFLAWSGRVLSAGRIARHDLIPFAVARLGPARCVLRGRNRVRAAPLQHALHPLRRDRRGIRDDLRALLRHGRRRRLGGRRPRGP